MAKQKQKASPISLNQKIDYKDIYLLTLFVTDQGKNTSTSCNGSYCSAATKIIKSNKKSPYIIFTSVCCIRCGLKYFELLSYKIITHPNFWLICKEKFTLWEILLIKHLQ